jgi:hypothetical protein
MHDLIHFLDILVQCYLPKFRESGFCMNCANMYIILLKPESKSLIRLVFGLAKCRCWERLCAVTMRTRALALVN